MNAQLGGDPPVTSGGREGSGAVPGAGSGAMRQGLVVEDLPVLSDWLVQTLHDTFAGIAVLAAPTLAAGRASIAVRAPDIALIDLGLPDGSGIELIREISERHPACQCIVTTIYADDQHLFPALRAGARGYLLKDQPREKTSQALRGIAAGEPPLSAAIARRLLRVFGDEVSVRQPSDSPRLTSREREALILIAKGYKIAEVASCLGVSRNTAAEFIQNVYRKLKINNRAEATLEAARLGLVDPHA